MKAKLSPKNLVPHISTCEAGVISSALLSPNDLLPQFRGPRNSNSTTTATEGSKPYQPLGLILRRAGKSAGRGSFGILGNLRIPARSEEKPDVKGDFHEAEIHVKQNCNMLLMHILQICKKLRNRIKTIATASNHRVCGDICGKNRRPLWHG